MNPINIKISNAESFDMLSLDDDLVAKNFIGKNDAYESMSMKIWLELSKHSPIIIDVGAYTGIYSLVAAKTYKTSKVYAFEALDVVYTRLDLNIQYNMLDNCFAYNIAVCNVDNTKIAFQVFNKHTKLTTGSSIKNRKPRPLVKYVDAITLDNKFKYISDKIGIIKIDAESAENIVLEGCIQILEQHKPDLLIEILPDSDIDYLNTLLQNYNYNFYNIDDNKMTITKIDKLVPSTGMHDLNKLVTTKVL